MQVVLAEPVQLTNNNRKIKIMSKLSNVRNDIKQVAQQIERLAKQIQFDLDQGKDIIEVANELARNSSTFVFTLGALYTLEELSNSVTKTIAVTTVSNPNGTSQRSYYHNVRDSYGRFARV